jgi:prepilin-type N-terminal cleavage/methylation domain-containing protein
MTSRLLSRRGFTLIELLLSLIVSSIIGTALVKMVLSQGRFMDQQEAWRQARSVSRSGINRLFSDLRAVENGSSAVAANRGLEAAVAGGQDFTIRVPYAFGILCGQVPMTNVYTVSLLPVDANMYAELGYSGFAVRNKLGVYNYSNSNTLIPSTTPGLCLTGLYDQINTVAPINGSPTGTIVNVTRNAGAFTPQQPDRGSIVFLYRRIRYEFKASVALPGRIGLWRTRLDAPNSVATPNTEELAAPFDVSARVNFYVGNNAVAQAAVPADLSTVRGLELVLNGASDRAASGTAAPKVATMTTSVFFENRPD